MRSVTNVLPALQGRVDIGDSEGGVQSAVEASDDRIQQMIMNWGRLKSISIS